MRNIFTDFHFFHLVLLFTQNIFMLKKLLFAFILISIGLIVHGQEYFSPSDHKHWTLDSLVEHSGGVITKEQNIYYLNEDLTISVTDTLSITEETTLKGASAKVLTIEGALMITSDETKITSMTPNSSSFFKGIIFKDEGVGYIENLEFTHSGGIRSASGNLVVKNSIFKFNYNGVTNSVLAFSNGQPLIQNNHFESNYTTAIATAANVVVAPIIEGNYFYSNNLENSNRPQINIAGSGFDLDSIRIINNVLIGSPSLDKVGAISITDFLGTGVLALIEGNHIEDNRYGITLGGTNIQAIVKDNMILNNNIEQNPMAGGSGINLISGNGTQNNIVVRGNHIEGNLWGITLQNDATVNLGTEDHPGRNSFYDNHNNNEVFALYNNTPNEVWALGNCWDTAAPLDLVRAEEVIVHFEDNSSYGMVHFDAEWCEDPIGIEESKNIVMDLYPNPANALFFLHSSEVINSYTFINSLGQVVMEQYSINERQATIDVAHLNPGVYFIRIEIGGYSQIKKVMIQR